MFLALPNSFTKIFAFTALEFIKNDKKGLRTRMDFGIDYNW